VAVGFLTGLALVLLTLVGYSYGCVLAGRSRATNPGPVDLPLTALLCAGALLSRGLLGRWWAIAGGIVAGGLVGCCASALRTAVRPRNPSSPERASLPRRAGDYQARLILLWFYAVLVTPIGLIRKLRRGPRGARERPGSSAWQPREATPGGLEEARRQF
jgi:hypothetical protein